jgi:hypothetical protein
MDYKYLQNFSDCLFSDNATNLQWKNLRNIKNNQDFFFGFEKLIQKYKKTFYLQHNTGLLDNLTKSQEYARKINYNLI